MSNSHASTIITKKDIVYTMSEKNEPAVNVEDGGQVVLHVRDSLDGEIEAVSEGFLNEERLNPATGPVFVEGAEPGDLLVAHIEKIELAESGFLMTLPKLNMVNDELTKPAVRHISIEGEEAIFSDDLRLPLNPMIGFIGTAPKGDSIPNLMPGLHGGNMDYRGIEEGADVILPVNVPGGLLALGDLHAAMGDGELGGSGLEIEGIVTIRLNIVKKKTLLGPMVINDDLVVAIATEDTLDEASQSVVNNMMDFMVEECGVDRIEAGFLLSCVGNLGVCQISNPVKTVRLEIPRTILGEKGLSRSSLIK